MTDLPALPARDHGGNLDTAMRSHGGVRSDWIDLSTGINPLPYPLPPIPAHAWSTLPGADALDRLQQAAAVAYGANVPPLPFSGAQAAIQAYPYLSAPGDARVLAPTYNEHAAALRHAGWATAEVGAPTDLEGAGLAVVVNPNNPDGRRTQPEELRRLARTVGLLVVDESFADPDPELSLVPGIDEKTENIVVLRSFGKFYGLAGMRLGFAVTGARLSDRLTGIAGPWPVSGPAISIATAALSDADWQRATTKRLHRDAARLDALADTAGWRLIGGTPLFRTYETNDAAEAQEGLARHLVWSRIFPYSGRWIRLGLPGVDAHWSQLEAALASLR